MLSNFHVAAVAE